MAHSFPPPPLRGGIHLPAVPPSLADAMKYSYTMHRPQPAWMNAMNILQAKALGPLSWGRELKKTPASPWVCPAGLQAAEDIDSPGSSPSSSPLVLSVAKETHLGWWYALLFLKCSPLSPGNVDHIFTLSMNQRVVWSASAQGFSVGTHLHDCHLWVSLGAVLVCLGAGWQYYHSSIVPDPNSHHLMCSSHQAVGL